eukprot:SAG25_NODE_116_length_14824_cov_126.788998_6_plen_166_part_00
MRKILELLEFCILEFLQGIPAKSFLLLLHLLQKCSSAAPASRVNHTHFNVVSNACIYGMSSIRRQTRPGIPPAPDGMPVRYFAGMYAALRPAAVAACCCCADTATQQHAAQAAQAAAYAYTELSDFERRGLNTFVHSSPNRPPVKAKGNSSKYSELPSSCNALQL